MHRATQRRRVRQASSPTNLVQHERLAFFLCLINSFSTICFFVNEISCVTSQKTANEFEIYTTSSVDGDGDVDDFGCKLSATAGDDDDDDDDESIADQRRRQGRQSARAASQAIESVAVDSFEVFRVVEFPGFFVFYLQMNSFCIVLFVCSQCWVIIRMISLWNRWFNFVFFFSGVNVVDVTTQGLSIV